MRVTIQPIYDSAAQRAPAIHEFLELIRYRSLLANLISRDLKVRYKRSIMGMLWAMVNPLLTMAVLVVVFTNLFRRFSVEHYPIYLLSGILIWRLFSGGTSVAMRSVGTSSGIRRKIYVPSGVFVASAIGGALVNLLFALLPLAAFALIGGLAPRLSWLLLPLPILLASLFAFGVGAAVAALAVFFADILDIYEVLLNAFFYLTPIIYPVTILPGELADLMRFNPMFQYIDFFRGLLIEGSMPTGPSLAYMVVASLAIAVLGWSVFAKLSEQFAYRT